MKNNFDPLWYDRLGLGMTQRVVNVQHVHYSYRDTSLHSGGGSWSISRTPVTQQFILEVGGMINKPRLQVFIYPGEPLVCLGSDGNGEVAMFVVFNLSINS